MPARYRVFVLLVLLAILCPWPAHGSADADRIHSVPLPDTRLSVHTLRAHGSMSRGVVLLASGDAGWRGMSKQLGERLAVAGYDIVGIDSKDYLSEATARAGAVAPERVPDDYLALLTWTALEFPRRSLWLAGVSEGAGLSILAAADDRVSARIVGVLGVGTPVSVTLAWRFWDWTVWLTHKEPSGPSVPTGPYLAAIAPTPVALIHASRDEYVSEAQVQTLFMHAREPRRLEVINAPNHRFTNARDALLSIVRSCLEWAATVPAVPRHP